MWLSLLFATASAADLVPEYDPSTPISWRVEVHKMKPMAGATGATMKQVAVEIYGGVLVCTPENDKREVCRLRNEELWWGYQDTPTSAPTLYKVTLPLTFHVTRKPTGHIVALDVQGDREAAWDTLIGLRGKLHKSGNGWVASKDDRRVWGQELELALARTLFGPLDVERPKKDPGEAGSWPMRELPLTALRYGAAIGGSSIMATRGETTPDTIFATFSGEANVGMSSSGDMQSNVVNLKLSGNALLRRSDGRIAATEIWTAVQRSAYLHDFTVVRSRAALFDPTVDPTPGPAPAH